MSLVGPRPALQREVATYTEDALRKLCVRPGLTGLWQVSGRSDLTWEESVRLDLRYVENWSRRSRHLDPLEDGRRGVPRPRRLLGALLSSSHLLSLAPPCHLQEKRP